MPDSEPRLRSVLPPGAIRAIADGVIGRGLASRQQKKLHGHSPALIRDAARFDSSASTESS